MKIRIIKYTLLFLTSVIFTGCAKEDSVNSFQQINDNIPSNALSIPDSTGDFILAAEGPPQVISYSPVDIKLVRLWKSEGYLYIKVDFTGVIPVSPPTVSGQVIQQQGFNVSVDTDNNFSTGASIGTIGGVDIFFAVLVRYSGQYTTSYANFNFQNSDAHSSTGHVEGEIRNGGPGFFYVTYRFSLSSIGAVFPVSGRVTLGGWSEAESSQYHHFAVDEFSTVNWNVQ